MPGVRPKRPPQDVQAYRPCTICGLAVLHGETSEGQMVPLDVGGVCYVVLWLNDIQIPRLSMSRAYPVHLCPGAGPDGASLVQ